MRALITWLFLIALGEEQDDEAPVRRLDNYGLDDLSERSSWIAERLEEWPAT